MQEVLQLQPYVSKWRVQGIAVFLVTQEEGPTAAFLEKARLSLPVLVDSHGEAAAAYGVMGIPHTVWIDKAGLIRYTSVGWNEQKLKEFDALAAALGK